MIHEKPIASRPRRRSFDVTITLKDSPSHAVSRLSTAGSDCSSSVVRRYFFIGPIEDVEVDADGWDCESSGFFLFMALHSLNSYYHSHSNIQYSVLSHSLLSNNIRITNTILCDWQSESQCSALLQQLPGVVGACGWPLRAGLTWWAELIKIWKLFIWWEDHWPVVGRGQSPAVAQHSIVSTQYQSQQLGRPRAIPWNCDGWTIVLLSAEYTLVQLVLAYI